MVFLKTPFSANMPGFHTDTHTTADYALICSE